MMKDYTLHTRGGVITERNADYATVRLRIPAGVLTADQLRQIARISVKYGDGSVHLTMRQTAEIPHVNPENLAKVAKALEKNGTPIGAEQNEVVNIMACPGTERCKYANCETIDLARKIDARVFGKELPIRLRIAISGCTYMCNSPLLNDIGIIGRIRPLRIPGLCTGCGTCVEYCKQCAISLKNGISVLDEEKCVQCGVCVHSCPYHLLKSEYDHYQITVGGWRGTTPRVGRELVTVETEEEVVEVVDRIVYWVYRTAWSGRPLADQMDEIGFEKFAEGIRKEFGEKAAEA
ncbi:MAG: Sulfite reductase, dissimilatory-type subunit beta [Euryarchaeota archaeon ADurb.Bin009]|jgi:dissimilatory sulfite reductase (desulfoviridin) alpha/beta subunit|uniref:4Fe-4S binding protein n=1 Tax=Methanoculleus sp. TaxID=90427 RepID=UPI0009D56055|nr:4Fe-4S binding protein [Methanoculleus sp.]OQC71173.1 MAG: Sulfite reductase, dissimilatory-type subunit beta [Euryarchaeota archaeon ADurb.Bin009]HNQ32684.1 4Fe-4S binding protein [Methanoculleus sp.]HOC83991.1 4Fe-4S binding protein [Methanoculleus sp.]HOF96168.1 4Fe-4S binding protein [Methanoculleus sp.]HOZ42497.1 4Fe-4S binding protein [Methanoculleus sp.]